MTENFTEEVNLAGMLNERRLVYRERPSNALFRSSSFDHPCSRYVYLETLHGKEYPDDGLKSIFNEGHCQEEQAIREILDLSAGFKVIDAQKELILEHEGEPLIESHPDMVLADDSYVFGVVEIKGYSPEYFYAISDLDSILNSKLPRIRMIYGQITLQMGLMKLPCGYILFKNKVGSNPTYKQVFVRFSQEYYDTLINRAIYLKKCLKEEKAPEGVHEHRTCYKCRFQALCAFEWKSRVDINTKMARDIKRFIELEKEMEALDVLENEYKSIKNTLKPKLEAGQSTCFADGEGNFFFIRKGKGERGALKAWREYAYKN